MKRLLCTRDTCKQTGFIEMNFGMLLLNHISWMGLLNVCIFNSGSTLGKYLVLALVAISALRGQFREVRLGETATFSRLPAEKEPPYSVFYRDSRNGLFLLDWFFCPFEKLSLEREVFGVSEKPTE